MLTKLRIIINHFANDSLYRNSIYLMSSTFVGAVFGFFFWIIAARFYSSEQIGLATAMISVTSLITSISMMGFNNGIIKYLPKTNDIKLTVNTSFTVVALISIVISIVYLLGLHQFSPALLFIKQKWFYSFAFIFIMFISTINAISDSVFVAKRDSLYVLIYNIIQNVTKLSLPFFLVSFGAIGIYLSVFGGILTAFLITFYFLYSKYKYIYSVSINRDVAKEMILFSSKNYIANFINGLPMLILPLIVLNRLGAKYAAYYYVAIMVANVVYIIPSAISRSFFAEGVHNEKEIRALIIRTLKITTLFLVPAVFGIIFFGKYILLAFGKQFSNEGFALLQLFTLTALLLPINSIGSTILNIKGRMGILFLICLINATLILMPLYLVSNLTLVFIGYIWLISHIVIAVLTIIIMYLLFIKKQ